MELETDLRAFDRERITVDATAGGVSLTASKYLNASQQGTLQHRAAKLAKIFVEGAQNLILDENGGTPSASQGTTLAPGQWHVVRGIEGMRKIRMIRASGVNAEAEVVYYR